MSMSDSGKQKYEYDTYPTVLIYTKILRFQAIMNYDLKDIVRPEHFPRPTYGLCNFTPGLA